MEQDEVRERLLALSEKAAADGQPLRWFEELYSEANRNSLEIPWAILQPNPVMLEWLEGRNLSGRALVVGCGLGDDADYLAKTGFDVLAFDISESCIDWCKERFPESSVRWHVEDLLHPPSEWFGAFDLVIEIHILQAIPEGFIRDRAAKILPKLLSEKGYLLCIGRLDDGGVPSVPPPPWPLEKSWLDDAFNSLETVQFTPFINSDTPEVERYVASWKR